MIAASFVECYRLLQAYHEVRTKTVCIVDPLISVCRPCFLVYISGNTVNNLEALTSDVVFQILYLVSS